jgi:uncharacterized protein YunC (DUF1805 family)
MEKWIKYIMIAGLSVIFSLASASCSATVPATAVKGDAQSVHQVVQLSKKQADGYVFPAGKVKVVCVVTDVGMAGCGAFDVMALDSFSLPAVKVKSSTGGSIATIDDLLAGTVKEVNKEAEKLGVKMGMTGREALDLL